MLSWFQATGRRSKITLPGSGILTVFQQQLRTRSAWHDLIAMFILVACQEAIAIGLQSATMPLREYSSDTPRFLVRWLGMAAISAPLLYLPCSAVMGAMAAPPVSRFEETQSILLTRLSAFDLCAGRLLAWLWPLISGILVSCALSFTVQLVWRPLLPESAAGYTAILLMHLVLLFAVLGIGAVGLLSALRRRPGRVWARGAGVALIIASVAIFGLFAVNSLVRGLDDPTRLIAGMLLINPATAAASALHMDVLRLPWIYERTDAPEYPFAYPPPLATCALYGSLGVASLSLAAIRLRRAYR